MPLSAPRPGRRLAAWLSLGLLAAVALAAGATPIVNFFADFNDASVQGPGTDKSFHVFGGTAIVHGPQEVFEIAFTQPGDGELQVIENTGIDPSALDCELVVPAMAKRIDVSWAMRFEGVPTALEVRFDDVGDTGVLDVIFDDQGNVIVNGTPWDLPLLAGEQEFAVHLALESHVLGLKLWTLTLTGPTQSATYGGTLALPTLNLSKIHLVRLPLSGGATGGVWFMDDLLVSSYDPSYGGFVPTGSLRK